LGDSRKPTYLFGSLTTSTVFPARSTHTKRLSPGPRSTAGDRPGKRPRLGLAKDNGWRRQFAAKLQEVGLEWVNFQALRRTHSSLLDDLGVDPQIRADQTGHGVDGNQNDYTKASLELERRKEAVNAL
jgi:integrase